MPAETKKSLLSESRLKEFTEFAIIGTFWPLITVPIAFIALCLAVSPFLFPQLFLSVVPFVLLALAGLLGGTTLGFFSTLATPYCWPLLLSGLVGCGIAAIVLAAFSLPGLAVVGMIANIMWEAMLPSLILFALATAIPAEVAAPVVIGIAALAGVGGAIALPLLYGLGILSLPFLAAIPSLAVLIPATIVTSLIAAVGIGSILGSTSELSRWGYTAGFGTAVASMLPAMAGATIGGILALAGAVTFGLATLPATAAVTAVGAAIGAATVPLFCSTVLLVNALLKVDWGSVRQSIGEFWGCGYQTPTGKMPLTTTAKNTHADSGSPDLQPGTPGDSAPTAEGQPGCWAAVTAAIGL